MPPPTANRRGILAIVVATACFSGNDAVVKVVAREAPLGEVLFVRGVMTCLLVGAVLASLGHVGNLRMAGHPLVLVRSGMEALAAFLFTTALLHMPLASLSTIVLIFREIVGWRRWTAISVGFVGTLFVVKPTPGAFDAWALLGVLCAFASAGRDLITRALPRGIPSLIVSFMAAVSVTVAGALIGLWETWRLLAANELALLALGAVFLAAGNFLVVIAYREGDVSTIAPFRYSLLVWAGIAGYLVFGELPDRWSAVGAALIVGSGLYALHREAVRARESARVGRPAAAGTDPTRLG